jgi:hypothetical protein
MPRADFRHPGKKRRRFGGKMVINANCEELLSVCLHHTLSINERPFLPMFAAYANFFLKTVEVVGTTLKYGGRPKMIDIEQPSMALNDTRDYAPAQMWNSWYIKSTDIREHIVDWTATVARGASGGKLKNIVICCHGNAGYLQLGAGFDRSHADLFKPWAGLVDKIWIRACKFAFIQTPGAPTTGDGNLFCSALAKAAQCYVVASTELQYTVNQSALPFGKLDGYEGLVLSYGPQGNVTWTHRYSSSAPWFFD